MAKQQRGKIESISDLMAIVYPGREPHSLSQRRAYAWWSKSVSQRILRNARPVSLKRGVMTIHTSTTAWANSLQFECEGFLAALHKHAPEAQIKSLVFRVGALPEIPRRYLKNHKKKLAASCQTLVQLPDELARALAKISDDNLREAVGRAVAAGLPLVERSPKQKRD